MAIELTLRWNHVSGVSEVASTGQLIPLVVGLTVVLSTLWQIYRKRVSQSLPSIRLVTNLITGQSSQYTIVLRAAMSQIPRWSPLRRVIIRRKSVCQGIMGRKMKIQRTTCPNTTNFNAAVIRWISNGRILKWAVASNCRTVAGDEA